MFDVAVTYLLRHHDGDDLVLLGEKLTGIGQGKIVAPGGKSEPGESPQVTAVREIREEVGLRVQVEQLRAVGEISYPFLGRPELSQRSFVFVAHEFEGTPQPSREMDATWWRIADIPYDRMWADAGLWLPRALAGDFVRATIDINVDNSVAEARFYDDSV